MLGQTQWQPINGGPRKRTLKVGQHSSLYYLHLSLRTSSSRHVMPVNEWTRSVKQTDTSNLQLILLSCFARPTSVVPIASRSGTWKTKRKPGGLHSQQRNEATPLAIQVASQMAFLCRAEGGNGRRGHVLSGAWGGLRGSGIYGTRGRR